MKKKTIFQRNYRSLWTTMNWLVHPVFFHFVALKRIQDCSFLYKTDTICWLAVKCIQCRLGNKNRWLNQKSSLLSHCSDGAKTQVIPAGKIIQLWISLVELIAIWLESYRSSSSQVLNELLWKRYFHIMLFSVNLFICVPKAEMIPKLLWKSYSEFNAPRTLKFYSLHSLFDGKPFRSGVMCVW